MEDVKRRSFLKGIGMGLVGGSAFSGLSTPVNATSRAWATRFNGASKLYNSGLSTFPASSRYGFVSVSYRSADNSQNFANPPFLYSATTNEVNGNLFYMTLSHYLNNDYCRWVLGPDTNGNEYECRFGATDWLPLPNDGRYHNIMFAFDTFGTVTPTHVCESTANQTCVKGFFDGEPQPINLWWPSTNPNTCAFIPANIIGAGMKWYIGGGVGNSINFNGDFALVYISFGVNCMLLVDNADFRSAFADPERDYLPRMASNESGVIPGKPQICLQGPANLFPQNLAGGNWNVFSDLIGRSDTNPTSVFSTIGDSLTDAQDDPFEPGSPV